MEHKRDGKHERDERKMMFPCLLAKEKIEKDGKMFNVLHLNLRRSKLSRSSPTWHESSEMATQEGSNDE
jgi:hypothetical protein